MAEFLNVLRMRFRALLHRRRLDRDLEDELALHLAMKQSASGADHHRRFGNVTLVKENAREVWTFHTLETLWQDVRFAGRLLKQSPIFAWTAILSLAIGIGANTAIFSVLDALIMKQLPVRDASELRILRWSSDARADMPFHLFDGFCTDVEGPSYLRIVLLSCLPSAGKSAPVYGPDRISETNLVVTAQGMSARAFGHVVSGNYFSALGVIPLLGRTLTAQDGKRRAHLPPCSAMSIGRANSAKIRMLSAASSLSTASP